MVLETTMSGSIENATLLAKVTQRIYTPGGKAVF